MCHYGNKVNQEVCATRKTVLPIVKIFANLASYWISAEEKNRSNIEPCQGKTCLLGFQPGLTQTKLYKHLRRLAA